MICIYGAWTSVRLVCKQTDSILPCDLHLFLNFATLLRLFLKKTQQADEYEVFCKLLHNEYTHTRLVEELNNSSPAAADTWTILRASL